MPLRLRAIRSRPTQRSNTLVDAQARAAIREYLTEVMVEMKKYPPQNSRSRYRRTYDLQKGWYIRSPSRYYGELKNDVYYATAVQGPRREGGRESGEHQSSRMRSYGWQSITDVSRRLAPKYVEVANRIVRGAIGDRPSKSELPLL